MAPPLEDPHGEDDRLGRVRSMIDAAGESSHSLRAVYEELVAEVGKSDADHLWWSAFGAADASET